MSLIVYNMEGITYVVFYLVKYVNVVSLKFHKSCKMYFTHKMSHRLYCTNVLEQLMCIIRDVKHELCIKLSLSIFYFSNVSILYILKSF